MDLARAVDDVLHGASLRQIAAAYRQELIDSFGFRPEEVHAETFAAETASFMRRVARHLGDRYAGNACVGQALREWVMQSDHYEAWDALMTGFDVPGRDVLLRRGKMLFPGPLTEHWNERGERGAR